VLAACGAGGPAGADRPSLDLCGAWEFRQDAQDVGKAEKWYAPGTAFEREIAVPGAWNAQGVGRSAKPGDAPAVFGLRGSGDDAQTLFHAFPGPGWYRRSVGIPADWRGKQIQLKFDGVHRYADVWVNGEHAGTNIGYVAPFQLDISQWAKPGEKAAITVRVDARQNKEIDALTGCLDTADFVYATWGGIHRKVTLEAVPAVPIDDVFVVPRLADQAAEVQVTLGKSADAGKGNLEVAVQIRGEDGNIAGQAKGTPDASGCSVIPVKIPHVKPWSPRGPYLYMARVTLLENGREADRMTVRFGMREFKTDGNRFLLNGKPFFVRGYGDDCIWPNTICPPADREAFRRRLQTAKDYGFNYVRHHSWCPPEEYFDAADELGLLLQPEFAIAYAWDLAKTPAAKQLYRQQWEQMIQAHRNHPSIAVWCMGNELYNSFDMAPEMYAAAKRLDPSRLVIDSDGCNLDHQSRQTLDFCVLQFGETGSFGYQDGKYQLGQGPLKPVIAHEMGYFVTLPDLTQTDLFRAGLRPYWLYQAAEAAKAKGVLPEYPRWVDCSNRLQALCLKANFEAARRRPFMSGYSQWLLMDYPNCAEGIVDMFHRPKALTAQDARKFNAPTVLLMDCPRRNYSFGETAKIKLLVSRYEDEPTGRAALRWELRRGKDVLASGSKQGLKVGCGGVQDLMTVDLAIPRLPAAAKLTLAVTLTDPNGVAANDWPFWAFPQEPLKDPARKLRYRGIEGFEKLYPWAKELQARPEPADCDLLVAAQCDEATLAYLEQGGRLLLLDPDPLFKTERVSGFRPAGWDPGQQGGHVGTAVQINHPALKNVPCEGWCDLQFYPLLMGAKFAVLDEVSTKIDPIVRSIDVPQRLSNRGFLFEIRLGKGPLLVSGFNFAGALKSNDPAAACLLDQLVRYGLSAAFAPQATVSTLPLRPGPKAAQRFGTK
jgi:hypothetical protein